ncbi:hypothetical protein B0T24DRAFT_82112 [Lasiosphaeria ovina]|uniref:Uncharacterized protein n=1 Tax=Lasiosphaeria ovina TaxID=92902 RepID=A0AAE0NMN5_9PEZI|nr:hypothetical protein B0T24DRAFT_82112 [Lasiosphaeria ovina]
MSIWGPFAPISNKLSHHGPRIRMRGKLAELGRRWIREVGVILWVPSCPVFFPSVAALPHRGVHLCDPRLGSVPSIWLEGNPVPCCMHVLGQHCLYPQGTAHEGRAWSGFCARTAARLKGADATKCNASVWSLCVAFLFQSSRTDCGPRDRGSGEAENNLHSFPGRRSGISRLPGLLSPVIFLFSSHLRAEKRGGGERADPRRVVALAGLTEGGLSDLYFCLWRGKGGGVSSATVVGKTATKAQCGLNFLTTTSTCRRRITPASFFGGRGSVGESHLIHSLQIGMVSKASRKSLSRSLVLDAALCLRVTLEPRPRVQTTHSLPATTPPLKSCAKGNRR